MFGVSFVSRRFILRLLNLYNQDVLHFWIVLTICKVVSWPSWIHHRVRPALAIHLEEGANICPLVYWNTKLSDHCDGRKLCWDELRQNIGDITNWFTITLCKAPRGIGDFSVTNNSRKSKRWVRWHTQLDGLPSCQSTITTFWKDDTQNVNCAGWPLAVWGVVFYLMTWLLAFSVSSTSFSPHFLEFLCNIPDVCIRLRVAPHRFLSASSVLSSLWYHRLC